MATAATPLSASPARARIAAYISVKSAASSSETDMTDLRPMASDSGPVISKPSTIITVVTERERLLCAGLRWKLLEKTGRIG